MTLTQLYSLTQLQQMQPITLDQMNRIKLMNRIDTKFAASESRLVELLERSKEDYMVQSIDSKLVAQYDTIYFDTPDQGYYLMHHNRHLTRQKVRTRTYVDSNLSFLEVKNKTNQGRTKKKRIEIATDDFTDWSGNSAALEFLEPRTMFDASTLIAQLRVGFNRITLVNKQRTERLTIDLNVGFGNLLTGQSCDLSGLMIVELKQDGSCRSAMKEYLRDMHIHPLSLSKYCIGTALTNHDVKQNRFKPKLRRISKIINN